MLLLHFSPPSPPNPQKKQLQNQQMPLLHLLLWWLHLFSLCSSLSSRQTLHSPVPRIAYFISGSDGENEMLIRVLLATYHPHNVYVVYFEKDSSPAGYEYLYEFIDSHPVFSKVGNVKMITRSNPVSDAGPTKVANVLHAAAILLKEGGRWDWFINLDAYSYPLVTQDDLLHVFSQLPRHLNFIDHTSQFAGSEGPERSQNVIIDQGLYTSEVGIIDLPDKRVEPTAFDLFSGSPWMGLTRSFIEYCVLGYDYLPRAVLLYHANSISSAGSYFHTVILNSPYFRNTTISTDLHFYKAWESPEGFILPLLTMEDRTSMLKSNAPFAREFQELCKGDVLDWIDRNLLSRHGPHGIVRGGWCAGSYDDPCLRVGHVTYLKPGKGAHRLQEFFDGLLRVRNVPSSSPSPSASREQAAEELMDVIRRFSFEESSNSSRVEAKPVHFFEEEAGPWIEQEWMIHV